MSDLVRSQAFGLATSVAAVLGSKGQVPSLDLEQETRPTIDVVGSTESYAALVGGGVMGFVSGPGTVAQNQYCWIRPGLDAAIEIDYITVRLTAQGFVTLVALNAGDAASIVADSFRRFFFTRTRNGYGNSGTIATPPLATSTLAEGAFAGAVGSDIGFFQVPATTDFVIKFPKASVIYGSRVFDEGQFIGVRNETLGGSMVLNVIGREWPRPL